MKRLPAMPSNREKSIGLPNRTVTRPKRNIEVPGGLTTFVPIIATGITGTPVCRASLPMPVLPLYSLPSGERVPSGYMPSNLPSPSSRSAVRSAACAESESLRSIGTWPTEVKNQRQVEAVHNRQVVTGQDRRPGARDVFQPFDFRAAQHGEERAKEDVLQ